MFKGENALELFKDYQRNNLTPPEGLLRPELPDGFEPWYEAFWLLSRDRQLFESGAGPIPLRSILSFPGIESDEFELFTLLIRAMDKAFLTQYHKDAEAAARGEPRKPYPRKIYRL